jgi:hypothetical protein
LGAFGTEDSDLLLRCFAPPVLDFELEVETVEPLLDLTQAPRTGSGVGPGLFFVEGPSCFGFAFWSRAFTSLVGAGRLSWDLELSLKLSWLKAFSVSEAATSDRFKSDLLERSVFFESVDRAWLMRFMRPELSTSRV